MLVIVRTPRSAGVLSLSAPAVFGDRGHYDIVRPFQLSYEPDMSIGCQNLAMVTLVAATLILQVQKPIEAFLPLVKEFGKTRPTATPNPIVSKALDLMTTHVYEGAKSLPRASAEWCEKRVSGFGQLLTKYGGELPTDFSWVGASVASQGNWRAISVNLGPISRTTVFGTTGKAVGGTETLRWLFGWKTVPQFIQGGSLALIGENVQDLGVQYQMRLDYLSLKGGKYLSSKPIIRKGIVGDFGSIEIKGSRIEIKSIENPKSFTVPATMPAISQIENFVVKDNVLSLVGKQDLSAALRFFDSWLYDAIKSNDPSPLQLAAREIYPDAPIVHNIAVSELDGKKIVILEFEDVRMKAVLRLANKSWIVEQVSRDSSN